MSTAHPLAPPELPDLFDPATIEDPFGAYAALRRVGPVYDERNGWRRPPQPSSYAPEFLARYRAAQLERARRLDARAYAWSTDGSAEPARTRGLSGAVDGR